MKTGEKELEAGLYAILLPGENRQERGRDGKSPSERANLHALALTGEVPD